MDSSVVFVFGRRLMAELEYGWTCLVSEESLEQMYCAVLMWSFVIVMMQECQ